MRPSTPLAFPLLALLSLATPACAAFAADADATIDDPALPAREAPAVGGPTESAELTEAFGVFVSPRGAANAPGTRERPLASIQAGIDLGKRSGKRVYVCAGTFREALVLESSIAVIGGLECNGAEWRTAALRTRVEAPFSPAVRASGITTLTRVEGLEIIAPSAPSSTPSTSSFGLVVQSSTMLVIARTRIVAGDAAGGRDGVEGIQLVASPTAQGGPLTSTIQCNAATCALGLGAWAPPRGGIGGTNACAGAPGHEAESGGEGGSGGLWQPAMNVTYSWQYYRNDPKYAARDGDKTRTSAQGVSGTDGTNAAAIGVFFRDGYAPADGVPGKSGAPGKGGAGGSGHDPALSISPGTVPANSTWNGYSGSGGGAGGCAGLAGTAGTGGGASVAALLIESPVVFEDSELVSARGGTGGRGTFGSAPTAGGHGGASVVASVLPAATGRDGGRGGFAGISGNGSSGPSIGIAHSGAPPIVKPGTTITHGNGGAAINARQQSLLGTPRTIPASPAGVTADVLAF